MKKVLVLLAASFLFASANYAQTGTGRSDTTQHSQKTMKKNSRRGNRKNDSNLNGSGSLTPMNNGSGRADSSNSGSGTMTPNQVPGQTPTQTPNNPTTTPTNPTPTPNPTNTPTPTPNPTPTPTPSPAPHK